MTDRLQEAMRAVNGALNPRLIYSMVWEYQVLSVTSPTPPVTIDCQAIDSETTEHLPAQLVGLQLWPGPSGCVALPSPGTIVRVAFANGDPSKPMVVGLDPSASPTLVFLDGAPGPFVARAGDTVSVTFTAADGALLVAPSGGGGGPCTVPGGAFVLTGTITSGSTKVQCP